MTKSMAIVTGGAGFIGSHLCKRLAEEGYFVISIDNYFTGRKENHHDNENIVYVDDDAKNINDNEIINSHLDKHKLKYVFHLGEYSRVEQSFDDVHTTCELNSAMPNICKFVREHDAKLIYSGSSTKFAKEGIISPYALTKAQNTEFLKYYAEWYGIDYAITYFYNVYGPGEIAHGQYSTVIAKFLKNVKNGEEVTVTRPGTQRRNFTYIDDIINGIMLVADKGHGDEYGIGNDNDYSILDVAFMMTDNVTITYPKRGNRSSAEVCNDKVKKLGWVCRTELEDYIKQELGSLRNPFDSW